MDTRHCVGFAGFCPRLKAGSGGCPWGMYSQNSFSSVVRNSPRRSSARRAQVASSQPSPVGGGLLCMRISPVAVAPLRSTPPSSAVFTPIVNVLTSTRETTCSLFRSAPQFPPATPLMTTASPVWNPWNGAVIVVVLGPGATLWMVQVRRYPCFLRAIAILTASSSSGSSMAGLSEAVVAAPPAYRSCTSAFPSAGSSLFNNSSTGTSAPLEKLRTAMPGFRLLEGGGPGSAAEEVATSRPPVLSTGPTP
mmetsp:Transcript_88350/g.236106  ORF Transcript_88350/g.236106 Transcript_88350/m.236106 type:complete len:250 (-) Transcript_88350:236-985(-)